MSRNLYDEWKQHVHDHPRHDGDEAFDNIISGLLMAGGVVLIFLFLVVLY